MPKILVSKCPNCGSKINNDKSTICEYCGTAFVIEKESKPEQNTTIVNNYFTPGKKLSKLVTVLLCLFVGWAGVHRFYQGKFGTGVLWLLTGGLFGIGWGVDCLITLFRPSSSFVYEGLL